MDKSELGAALALNMLVNNDEWKAEAYSCASDRQQAAIVLDVAVDIVQQNPTLSKLVKIIPSIMRGKPPPVVVMITDGRLLGGIFSIHIRSARSVSEMACSRPQP